MEAVEAELFPTKSYTEIKQGLPASTLKAVGGRTEEEVRTTSWKQRFTKIISETRGMGKSRLPQR